MREAIDTLNKTADRQRRDKSEQPSYATLSHMDVGVRDLRNHTGRVIDAVMAGERVTLTVRGEPVADVVPHGRRARWLSGPDLRSQLTERAADPVLQRDLDELVGQTLDEL